MRDTGDKGERSCLQEPSFVPPEHTTANNPSPLFPQRTEGTSYTAFSSTAENSRLGYVGALLSAREDNASYTDGRHRRGGNAPTGSATAARALKWRPWGRRITAKLRNKRWQEARQRHLPGSALLSLAGTVARHRLAAVPGRSSGSPLPFSSALGSPELCRELGNRTGLSTSFLLPLLNI